VSVINFLLAYDRRTGALEIKEFRGENARARALAARLQTEGRSRGTDREVVVIAADSKDELRRTHARYFQTVGDLARSAAKR
jgi:hypothetical protein